MCLQIRKWVFKQCISNFSQFVLSGPEQVTRAGTFCKAVLCIIILENKLHQKKGEKKKIKYVILIIKSSITVGNTYISVLKNTGQSFKLLFANSFWELLCAFHSLAINFCCLEYTCILHLMLLKSLWHIHYLSTGNVRQTIHWFLTAWNNC